MGRTDLSDFHSDILRQPSDRIHLHTKTVAKPILFATLHSHRLADKAHIKSYFNNSEYQPLF